MGTEKYIVSAGYDHSVRVWDPATGVIQRQFEFNDSQVNRLRFSQDGRLLAVCGNPRVAFFDLRADLETPVHTLDLHRNNVTDIDFCDTGSQATTCSEDSCVYVWDLRVPDPVKCLKNDAGFTGITFGRNKGLIATADYGQHIRIWDIQEGRVVGKLSLLQDNAMVLSLSYSIKTGLLCFTGSTGYAYICRVTGGFTPGENISNSVRQNGKSNPMIKSPKPKTQHHIREESRSYFEKISKMKCCNRYVLRCCLSDDSLLAAAVSENGSVDVWGDSSSLDVLNEGRWQSYRKNVGKHQKWAWDCKFSKDGKRIFSCSSDKRVCLWDISNGDLLKEYRGHQKGVTCIDVFSV
eukprot:jgi/Galph1/3327/GphlegSOOS_G1951.1